MMPNSMDVQGAKPAVLSKKPKDITLKTQKKHFK